MQTFLPYAHFQKSLEVLDNRRLGKQRREAVQILERLLGFKSDRWIYHPATLMWCGHEPALLQYLITCRDLYEERGFDNTVTNKDIEHLKNYIGGYGGYLEDNKPSSQKYPSWHGNPQFHRSHRSNLLRKKPDHYNQFWKEPTNLPYVWPVRSCYNNGKECLRIIESRRKGSCNEIILQK